MNAGSMEPWQSRTVTESAPTGRRDILGIGGCVDVYRFKQKSFIRLQIRPGLAAC